MHLRFLTGLTIAFWSTLCWAQTPPTLPNAADVETCFPDTSGYAVITVGPVGRDFSDLQTALNAAAPGSILVLDAGAAFKGSFTLPNKTGNGWIILMSSHTHLLPQAATRIAPDAPTGNGAFPTQKDTMPKIVTTNPSGLPCLRTQASAHHYRFVGLELTVDTSVVNSYGLVFFGDASAAQNTLSKVPHDLVVDRCYIHGHDKATVMKAGILLNSANTAIVDSYLSDFHSIGFDTYAIGGTNGPGPFKILNNYLEAAGENILFGGAAPAIPNLVPADIEVRLNHFFKPFSWRVGHPGYAGKHWTIKNLFELKTGKRVLLDANRKFHKNVLMGGNAARYSNYATASQNFFPNTSAGVQFVNYGNGINNYRDYDLAGTSPYKHAASDGSDIGVDFVRLDSAWLARETCIPTVSVFAEPDRPEIRLYPNPFRDHLAVASPVPLEDAALVLFNATGQEVRRFSKLNGQAVMVATGDLPPGIYFAALWQAEQVLARSVLAVAK